MRAPRGMVARLMLAQLVVVGVGAIALAVTAWLVGPSLFDEHLARTGEDAPAVIAHAQEAFASSFAIAIGVSLLVSLVAAGLLAVVSMQRVAAGVVDLADAADTIAAGNYTVEVPSGGSSAEMVRLSAAFGRMAHRLAATEAARTAMLADLSHELRTPLATLEAYVDGLEDGVMASDAASYAVMRDQVERLRRLAVDVRTASEAEEHAVSLQPQALDARDLAGDAVAFSRPSFLAKGVSLELAVPDATTRIRVDPVRMQQVLGNLLANALRHTAAGGHVRVSVRPGPPGLVAIAVADDGEGLPADQLEAVFARFHRVDPSRAAHDGSGAGLGLTIARAIVAGHGGTLTAASPGPGLGATLTIHLPAA